MTRLIITVGNDMIGDDGSGPLLARTLEQSPLQGWQIINGGSVPENYLHVVNELKPDVVVVVDAAEMGLEPGSIRLLSEKDIAGQFILTTHNLPLSFFIGALKEIVPTVYFIGIQPRVVAFGLPLSDEVKRAVEIIYQKLQAGSLDFPAIEDNREIR